MQSVQATTDLAERLQQVFTKPWENADPTEVSNINTVAPLLKDVPPPTLSVGQVKNILGHLNTQKTTGPDKIPAWLLKWFCEERAPVVPNIVCASIAQCKYPEWYKHALINSVPKIYPPNDIDNNFRTSIARQSSRKKSA